MTYALGVAVGTARTVTAAIALPPATAEDDGGYAEPPAPSLTVHDTAALLASGRPADADRSSDTAPADRLSLSDSELQYVTGRFLARVGDSVPLLGRPDLAADLVAARVVEAALGSVAAELGERPRSLVVVHPGSWQGHRRQVLLRALADFGLEPTALLSRPVLTALRYAARAGVEIGQSVLTVDVGTRAAESSVVRRTAIDTFEIVGRVHVDTSCGGIRFDDALIAHLVPAERPGASRDSAQDLVAWRRAAKAAKEALSSAPEVMVEEGTGAQRMTRSEFDVLIAPVLQRITDLVDRTLTETPEAGEVAAIVLVGGAASVPAIALSLGDTVAPPVIVDEQPELAVAAGAGIAAWFLALEEAAEADEYTSETEDELIGMRRLLPTPRRIRETLTRATQASADKWPRLTPSGTAS